MNARSAALLSVAIFAFLPSAVPAEVPETRVRVDAGATGAPISPLIYGQFIEHLGRCVYGGLWAEMLEDRKFFHAVTGEAPPWEMYTPGPRWWDGEGHAYELLMRSPWMILGDKRALRMVRDGALAGQHSVELTPRAADPRGVGAAEPRVWVSARSGWPCTLGATTWDAWCWPAAPGRASR